MEKEKFNGICPLKSVILNGIFMAYGCLHPQKQGGNILSESHMTFSRPSVSPIGFNSRSNTSFSTPDSQVHKKSLQSASNTISEAAARNLTSVPVAKRTRSPPLLPEDQVFHGNSYATQDGTER